jgi:hypothetical protein
MAGLLFLSMGASTSPGNLIGEIRPGDIGNMEKAFGIIAWVAIIAIGDINSCFQLAHCGSFRQHGRIIGNR